MLSYGRVRSAFAYAFPLLLGSLYILAGHYVYQHYLAKQSEANRNQLLGKASILAARVKSEYSITQQAEKAFRLTLEKANEISAMRPFSVDLEFSDLVRSSMPPQLLSRCRIWAFSNQNGNFVLANSNALMQTKRKAMERAFTALINLADKHTDASSSRTAEKFIAGLFGENSAPEYLASQRLGQMTPVQFEGKPHYVYWQRFSRHEYCNGGFIALFPGNFVEDIRGSIRILATRLVKESGDDLFISFPGSPLVDHRFAPVFAEQHQTDSGQFKSAMRSLQKLIYGKKQLPMRQLYETGDWWHYLDLISQDTHHYLAISGKKPVARQRHIALPGLAIFAATWSAIFFLRLRHSRFTLGLAFKMLFFMTGMLPVLAFSFLGISLIDQSHEVAIQQEITQAYSRIEQIDEKSEECVALTGMIIKELLEDRKIHHGLVDAMPEHRQEAFTSLKDRMYKRGFYLNYLLLIHGGKPAEYYISAPVHLPYAKYHLEYYTISASALNDVLIKQTRLPAIPLSTSQKSLLNSLGGAENPSAKDVFLSSLDRINSFQAGSVARHVFFTTILGNNDQIGCYLVLGLSVAETVLEMLKNQLNLLNSDPRNLFFCFSRDFSTGLKIFPANHRFITSADGQQFRQFLESAASSMFRIEIRRPDEVFIYEPLAKVKHYFGGAVIGLHETNRQRDLKLILLTLMSALLAGTIYLLASAVSSLMIQPAHQLTRVFKEVASGNYSQEFSYPFNNELGQLATATSQMVKGLKERRLLGKFVSTTFDAGVKISHQQASGQEIAGTVLFSDIRNFTTLSESYPPQEIGNLLNTHLREMVEIIHNCSGRVEQFIGDAIVAFFPVTATYHAQELYAATTMMQQHIAIQANRRGLHKPTYEIGIGLDFGTVMAGILHSGNRSEFTVIGPTRSCAEHCEAASKTGRFTRIIATRQFAMATPEFNNRFTSHNADFFELESLETRS